MTQITISLNMIQSHATLEINANDVILKFQKTPFYVLNGKLNESKYIKYCASIYKMMI